MAVTIKEAEAKAKAEYKKLWGNEWIQEKKGSIFADSYNPLSGETQYKYSFVQIDRLLDPPKDKTLRIGGNDYYADHMTTFVFDLAKGTMQVTEHY